jgi:hypothetical protein
VLPTLLCFAGAAGAGAAPDHAVAVNNIDVASEYIQKLRQELEGHSGEPESLALAKT